MAKSLAIRGLHAALLVFITLLLCWIITAFHGIWSLGIVRDYLNGGRVPLYPTLPVTYKEFFFLALPAIAVPFLPALLAISLTPNRFITPVLGLLWLIGFWIGAGHIGFTFQFDFGTTWGPTEAFRALFFHPIVTPFSIAFGLMANYAITRRIPRPT